MAGLIAKIRGLSDKKKKKFDSNSIYSVVSCSDLTPGSLEIWVDLPNEIKFDPSLAPFKHLYEQHHGKLESETPSEGDKTIFTRKTTELETIGEVDSSDLRPHDEPPAPGERLINGPINEETEQASAKRKRISRLLSSVKLAFLVACWLLLTVALLLNRETGDLVLHTAVQAGSAKEYTLEPSSGRVRVLIKLTGPFRQNGDSGANGSEHGVLRVWLRRRRTGDPYGESSTYWDVPLQPDSVIDFSRSEVVTKILKLPNDEKFMGTRKGGLNRTISNYTEVEDAGNVTEHNSRSDIDKGASVDEREGLQAVRDVSNATFHRDVRNVAEHIATTYVPDKVVAMSTNGDTIRDSQVEEIASRNQSKRQASDKSDGADSDINSTDTELREDFLEDDASKGNLDLRVTIKDTSNENVTNNSLIRNIEKETLKLHMDTTSNATVPVTLTYKVNPLEEDGVIYATILLCFLYVLIIFEVVNRTVAALLSSSLGIAVLALGGSRPSLGELVSWLDVETLLLLFSMMLLVAILAETGLFDYLAVVAFELTGGRTWPLINCLCLFTAVFSTFLDNVTTVLLMTPVTIRLCEVMQLNPVPVLMAMVVFSNVGGAATPVGDPPNVIIASHPVVVAEGINFVTFTVHMGLGVLLVAVQTYLQLRFMFRDIRKLRHNVPHDIQELRQEMAVWRRAAASLSSYSRDEDIVRKALEKKVEKLQKALVRREAGGGSKTDPKFCSTLAQMKQKYRIRDKQLLIKSTICVTFVVVVFFLHCIPELQRLSLGWTALLGALLLLLLADHDDLEPILARVEWSTLLFFAALFVLMEALSKLGLITWIGNITEMIIRMVSEESRLAVALMLVLWVSGIASAFVDNIPLTTMMVRVMAALAAPDGLALPLAPLAWALSFGACLGGNGTLIGASANVVCAGVAEQHGYRFTFMQFFKIGFPIMIGHLMVASIYLLICHCAFTWH